MLDQDDLRNIKDLLESTISASEGRLRGEIESSEERLRGEIEASEARLRSKIEDLSQDVAEALEITNNAVETSAKEEIRKHEERFHKLKTRGI